MDRRVLNLNVVVGITATAAILGTACVTASPRDNTHPGLGQAHAAGLDKQQPAPRTRGIACGSLVGGTGLSVAILDENLLGLLVGIGILSYAADMGRLCLFPRPDPWPPSFFGDLCEGALSVLPFLPLAATNWEDPNELAIGPAIVGTALVAGYLQERACPRGGPPRDPLEWRP